MRTSRRKRVFLLIAAMIAVMVIGFVAVRDSLSRSQPTEPSLTKLESVHVGMTRVQVWDAIGVPPGTYPEEAQIFHRVGVRVGYDVWRCAGSNSELHVWYDNEGRVADAVVYRPGVEPPERFQFRLRSK